MVTAIVVIVVLALLVSVGLILVRRSRRDVQVQRRRAELQERFGPEYERFLAGSGNRAKAERRLVALVDRRDRLEIRDLAEPDRARFAERWVQAQARFVDEPPQAVDEAETLITEVMKTRGYPVDSFATRADMVMVDHAEIVHHFRSAHESHERHRASGTLDTEDLRQAFMHYRTLFRALTRVSVRPTADRPTADRPVVGSSVSPQQETRPVPAARAATADTEGAAGSRGGRPPVTSGRSESARDGTGRDPGRDEQVAAAGTTGSRRAQETR